VPQDYGNSEYNSGKISDVIQSLPGPLGVRGSRTFGKESRARRFFKGEYLGIRINEYLKKSLLYESDTLNAFMSVLRYAWLSSTPTYHFWGVPFDGQFRSFTDDEYDGAFLAALFWGLGGQVSVERQNYSHVSRRELFPSWTWAGWCGLEAIGMSRARGLQGRVSLRDLKDTPFRLQDYLRTMRQSWNMYDFKPLLYATGWFAMIRVESHERGMRWVAVGPNDHTDESTATVPFTDVDFLASSPGTSFHDLGVDGVVATIWPAIIFTPLDRSHYIWSLLLKSVDDEAFERFGRFSTAERDNPGQTYAHATSSRVGDDIDFVIPALRRYEGGAKLKCKWITIKLV
jgi:hypothetical protein